MRQVSPLPAGNGSIQVSYGKPGTQQQFSSSREPPDAEPEEESGETVEETPPLPSAPPGMGRFIDKIV